MYSIFEHVITGFKINILMLHWAVHDRHWKYTFFLKQLKR